ncbi:MAG: glycosyltransferase family 2 protein, partial [Candidatus Nanohaloarchaea archaeon]
ELNEHFWEALDAAPDAADDYIDAYEKMIAALEEYDFSAYENSDFIPYVIDHMRDWLDCCRAIRGSVSRVAAFMPTLNEAGTVDDAIRSLADQTHPVEHLTVVDGGSTDGTVAEVRSAADDVPFDVDVEVVTDGGVRYASQIGAEHAIDHLPGDGVVLRIEGDSVLSDKFVEEAVQHLRQDEYVCYGAKVEPRDGDGGPVADAFRRIQNLNRYPKGRGMAFRASDFDAVDGYLLDDESAGDLRSSPVDCFGDAILTAKLRDRGTLAFSESATVRSTVPSTSAVSLDRWKRRMLLEPRIAPRLDINDPLQHFPRLSKMLDDLLSVDETLLAAFDGDTRNLPARTDRAGARD